MGRCTAKTAAGARCKAVALRDGERCYFHAMSPQERIEHARQASRSPKRARLVLPELRTPTDALKAMDEIVRATATGRITMVHAQRLEAQLDLWLKLYQQETIDFKRVLDETNKRWQRKLQQAQQVTQHV